MASPIPHFFRTCLLLCCTLALVPAARAAMWTVDDDRHERSDADFTAIGAAMTRAVDGDQIVVYPGTYRESVGFGGKNVQLRSTTPADPNVVRATVIDPQYTGSAIRFQGSETSATLVEGFTLTGGRANRGGAIFGGSIGGSRAAIRYNIIQNNVADDAGGALSNCHGTIQFNTIGLNFAVRGGAFMLCNGLIANNEVHHNRALDGGAFYLCFGTLRKNVIHDNLALAQGGALNRCGGVVEQNLIRGNQAIDGGGLMLCEGTVRDNQIIANTADRGGAFFDCKATIQGNLISKNRGRLLGGALARCNQEVLDNQITGNMTDGHGAGIAEAAGARIEGNRIEQNTAAGNGGGLYACSGVIRGNRVLDNQAGQGGGLADCSGLIEGNRVEGNWATVGGGFWNCDGTARNNLVQANRAARGAALDGFRGALMNNTFAWNTGPEIEDEKTSSPAPALQFTTLGVVLRNNIFHRNGGVTLVAPRRAGGGDALLLENNLFHEPQYPLLASSDGSTTYTTVRELEAGYPPSAGNLDADPLLAAPTGADGDPLTREDNDLHLLPGSPAIDAGLPATMAQLPARDLDGFARMVNLRLDLGCYESGATVDTDGDGLGDTLEIGKRLNPNATDTDGDGASDTMELLRGTTPLKANLPLGLTASVAGGGVQLAIMQAFNGETVRVEPGHYSEALLFEGKTLRLIGSRPDDPATVAATVIDAGGHGPVIVLRGDEGTTTAIQGLTLTHGWATNGSAIQGNGVAASVTDNLITSNTATGDGTIADVAGAIVNNEISNNLANNGGAVARGAGVVSDNRILDNRALNFGGGLYFCSGKVTGNRFERNRAGAEGGAIDIVFEAVEDNVFVGNFAPAGGAIGRSVRPVRGNQFILNTAGNGAALFQCSGEMSDNSITSNTANEGGGIASSRGSILRNRIVGNVAHFGGGGLIFCDGPIEDNILENNYGYGGGAITLCGGPIRRNTIRGNTADSGAGLAACGGEVADNVIENNQAKNGGAIYDSDGSVHGNLIRGNRATAAGGGLWGCDGRVENNRIERNEAVDGGGFHGGRGVIANNFIQGNTAEFRGGGFMSCDAQVFGNLILLNRAQFGGGFQTGRASVRNNTIVANGALAGGVGGGIHNIVGPIENNIFWSNTQYAVCITEPQYLPASLSANAFFVNWDGHLAYRVWNIYFHTADIDAELPGAGGNFEFDPQFVNPLGPDLDMAGFDDNDFRLRPDSPCIDMGMTLSPPAATDLDGGRRVVAGFGNHGPVIDLGAYEFLGILVLTPAEPITIEAGKTLDVQWESSIKWSGTAVRFELWDGGRSAAVLGDAWSPDGRSTQRLMMPSDLPRNRAYALRAISLWDGQFWGQAPGTITLVDAPANPGATAPPATDQRTQSPRSAIRDWHQYR